MAAVINMFPDENSDQYKMEDDFVFNNNVAKASVYIRLGFLRKVYSILTTQLLFTTVVCAVFISSDNVKEFVKSNEAIALIATFGTFLAISALMFKRKETPINFYLLGLFTLMESYAVGFIVTHYDASIVVQAFFLTVAVTVSLTIYTMQSKRDFSVWGASLFAVIWIFLIAGMMQIFIQSPMLELGISVGGAILFSLFIIFDTYNLLHKHSEEEYLIAAIDLYLDIINLFLYILRILNETQRK